MRIYKEAFKKTEKGAITLGWKFELLNKPAGELSGKMSLTKQQIYDVYAGTNLSEEKRYDGNRPLAVQVDWKIVNEKLTSDIEFEYPLKKNGTEMANRLLNCLNKLSIETTDDINETNADMSHVYE